MSAILVELILVVAVLANIGLFFFGLSLLLDGKFLWGGSLLMTSLVVSFSRDVFRRAKDHSTAVSSSSSTEEVSKQESFGRRRQQEWEIYKRRLMVGRRKEAEER